MGWDQVTERFLPGLQPAILYISPYGVDVSPIGINIQPVLISITPFMDSISPAGVSVAPSLITVRHPIPFLISSSSCSACKHCALHRHCSVCYTQSWRTSCKCGMQKYQNCTWHSQVMLWLSFGLSSDAANYNVQYLCEG